MKFWYFGKRYILLQKVFGYNSKWFNKMDIFHIGIKSMKKIFTTKAISSAWLKTPCGRPLSHPPLPSLHRVGLICSLAWSNLIKLFRVHRQEFCTKSHLKPADYMCKRIPLIYFYDLTKKQIPNNTLEMLLIIDYWRMYVLVMICNMRYQ